MYRYNDRPWGLDRVIGPQTKPTLKLVKHGGGTVGGPVRVYTSNPFSFLYRDGRVMGVETILLANRHAFPEHAILDELQQKSFPAHVEAPRRPEGGHGGQFAWPDTSVGSGAPVNRFTGTPYPSPAPDRPVTFWEGLLGAVGLQRRPRR